VGSQLVCLCTTIILLALVGQIGVHRHGALNAASCFLYAFTSFVAGFVSCRFYKQMGEGSRWIQCVHLTSSLFAVPFFIVWGFQNTVAWAYNSTQALPVITTCLMIAVWLFVGTSALNLLFNFEFVSSISKTIIIERRWGMSNIRDYQSYINVDMTIYFNQIRMYM